MANKAFGVSNINATGSVGIGTNNPLVPLHISGTNGLIVEDSTNQKLGDLRCKNDIVELNAYDPANSNAAVPIVFKHYTTEVARFNTSGNLAFPSAKGIDFSATSDATGMENELLEDYEEGTYTPTITLGSGTINTNHHDALSYVKVGRLVHVQGRIHLTLSASDVTSFTFTLPFANCSALSENAEDTSSVTHVIRSTAAGTNVTGIRHFRFTANSATVSMQNGDGANTGHFGVNNPHINVNFQYRST